MKWLAYAVLGTLWAALWFGVASVAYSAWRYYRYA